MPIRRGMAQAGELPPNIDVALNEASWLGVELDTREHRLAIWFDVLTLPAESDRNDNQRVTLFLTDVHRFVASHRLARWDDDDARAEPCTTTELPRVVRDFGRAPVYGWEFFDTPDSKWARWADRLSLDVRWMAGEGTHSIDLFQEGRRDGQDRHLDFRAWFERVTAYDLDGNEIPLNELAEGGRRWWDGLRSGDERTANVGIYPLSQDPPGQP